EVPTAAAQAARPCRACTFPEDRRFGYAPTTCPFCHQTDHEFTRTILQTEFLKEEAIVFQFKVARLIVAPVLVKTEVAVEASRKLEVLGGDEGCQIQNFASDHAGSEAVLGKSAAQLLLRGRHRGLLVRVLLREAFHAAGRIDQLLLAREKRMTARADFRANRVALDGRTRLKRAAAGAMHRDDVIIRMNAFFH